MRSSGNLSVGAAADVAVLRLVNGDFGFVDSARRAPARDAKAGLRDHPERRAGGLGLERVHQRRLGSRVGIFRRAGTSDLRRYRP